jgi:hypothetical protein
MAKFEQPFEDTKAIFDSLILNANLDRYVTIEVLVNNKQREIYKPIKTNDLTKYKTGVDVFLVINEKVFDQLNDVQKVIIGDEAVSGIHYDSEKEKLVISKTDFTTYSGILKKYGAEQCIELKELINLIYAQEKNSEVETEA